MYKTKEEHKKHKTKNKINKIKEHKNFDKILVKETASLM